MAKISKKRFLELAEECCIDINTLNKGSFVGQLYAELNKPKNKWITWNGGACPVDPNTSVMVKFRDGEIIKNQRAGVWMWENYAAEDHDIIAYKVIDNS